MTRERLLEAIGAGDTPTVRALLAQQPALAASRDDDGVSVVLLARYRWDGELVAAVRAADPPLDAFDAAALGELAILEACLASDPGAATELSGDGFSALHYAAYFGGPAVARALLAAGADPAAVARNETRVQPLHSAVAGRQPEVAAMLLEAGADPDATQRHGWTALHSAADGGLDVVVDALLAAGASPAPRNDDGATPADLARAKGHAAIAARLGG